MEICDKIDKAVDNKAQLQDVMYLGEVLEYSKQCELIKKHDCRAKRFKSSGEFHIKHELLDTSSEEEEEDTQPAAKKKKTANNSFAGEPDGHFQYTKQKENNAASHHFVCDLCEVVFRDTNGLRNHESTHAMEFYHCMKCFKVFQSVRAFENHRASHTSSHTCDICGKFFNLKTTLTNHLQIHSTDKMKCSHHGCTKTFKWRQNQLEHIQWVHRDTKDVPCTHCPKMFQTPMSMRTHRVNTHRTVPEITPGHPDGHGKKTTSKNTSKPKQPVSAAASKPTPEDQQGNDDFDERLIGTLTIQ